MKQTVELELSFFKTSGKWYADGLAYTKHFLFEDEFMQDIINTQTGLIDGWNEHDEFIVVVNDAKEIDGAMGFHKRVIFPNEIRHLRKED